jgi:hypothetical protein
MSGRPRCFFEEVANALSRRSWRKMPPEDRTYVKVKYSLELIEGKLGDLGTSRPAWRGPLASAASANPTGSFVRAIELPMASER